MSTHDDGKSEVSEEAYREMAELTRIGNRAVRRAQEENRKRGIPNVYSIRGHICYEKPDGTFTQEDPYPETKECMDTISDENESTGDS